MNTIELTKIKGTVHEITPASGNRSGKIKLDSGQILSAYPPKLTIVSEGEAGEWGCTETHKNGAIFYDVKAARMLPPVTETFRAPAPQPPRPQPQPQRSAPVQQPAPQNGNGNGWYRPTHPRDAERMFVCSTLNAYIQTGRINDDVDRLILAVNTLRQVWQETFGADDLAAG